MKLEFGQSLRDGLAATFVSGGRCLPPWLRDRSADPATRLFITLANSRAIERVYPRPRETYGNLVAAMKLLLKFKGGSDNNIETQALKLAQETINYQVVSYLAILKIFQDPTNPKNWPELAPTMVPAETQTLIDNQGPFIGFTLHSYQDYALIQLAQDLLRHHNKIIIAQPQTQAVMSRLTDLLGAEQIKVIPAPNHVSLLREIKDLFRSNRNGAVFFHGDRPPENRDKGVKVQLFRQEAVFPRGPAFFSSRHQVPVVPFLTFRNEQGLTEVFIGTAVPPPRLSEEVDLMQQVIGQLEPVIAAHPASVFSFFEPIFDQSCTSEG